MIVKILDMGFFEAFDRPFNPIADGSYTGIGIETLRDSIGRTEANLLVAGAAVLCVAVLVLTTLALLRLTRVAAVHRRWSFPAVTALGVVWVLCWAFGAQLVSHAPIASTSAAGLVSHEVRAVQAGVEDHANFADDIRHDRFRDTRSGQLLTGLRGKDVLARVRRELREGRDPGLLVLAARRWPLSNGGTERLRAAGFSSRSAFLTSSTFGGLSWLAHSTMQSGVWVDTQLRYDQLVKTDRLTLSGAFKRAGWRTVGDAPSNNRAWPRGIVVLPLRQALRPAQRRVSRPEVLVRLHARSVRPRGPAAPRARETRPPSHLRGGRPGVEPHAVDEHPPDGRLERRRRRLDLQAHAGGRADAGRALRRPQAGASGVRPVHPLHA